MNIPFSIRFWVISGISLVLLNTACEKQLSVVEKGKSKVVIVAGSATGDEKAAKNFPAIFRKSQELRSR